MLDFKRYSATLAEARQAAFQPSPWLQPLLFIGVFIAANILSALILVLVVAVPAAVSATAGGEDAMQTIERVVSSQAFMLAMTVPTTIIFILYARYVERRPARSIGFSRRRIFVRYAAGLAAGAAMCAVVLGIVAASGAMTFAGVAEKVEWGAIAALFVGFLFQGMSEEVMLRGCFMVSLANRAPVWVAVAISSAVFAALHLLNPGVTLLAFVNLVLYGVFAALYFLRTDNIWGIAALHSAWNFVQGNVFGVEVSGMASGNAVVRFAAAEGAPDWLSGGSFGLEGGVAATAVFGIGIALLLSWPRKTRKKRCKEEPRAYSVS